MDIFFFIFSCTSDISKKEIKENEKLKFAIPLSVNEVLQISNHNDLSVIYYLQIDSHHEKIEAQAFTS